MLRSVLSFLDVALDLLENMLELIIVVVDSEDALNNALRVIQRINRLVMVKLVVRRHVMDQVLLVRVDDVCAQVLSVPANNLDVVRVTLADIGKGLEALPDRITFETVNSVKLLALVFIQLHVAVQSLELR